MYCGLLGRPSTVNILVKIVTKNLKHASLVRQVIGAIPSTESFGYVGVKLLCVGASEYSYYAIPHATAYVNTVPFLGTVYFDASVISYLRQQMYVYVTVSFSHSLSVSII